MPRGPTYFVMTALLAMSVTARDLKDKSSIQVNLGNVFG